MTPPTDPSAGGAPSLPDATPPVPETGDAPFLPAASRPQPVAPEPAPFDARALVESQKRVNENPAYGALPEGTEESREAARRLREIANRKRRRNKLLGWMVVLVLLAGIAAAGFLAYREYQDDQDRRAAERAAAQLDDAAQDGDQIGAPSPLGEQVEVVEAMDDTNDVVQPSAGGFLGAIDDARDAVDDLNEVQGEPDSEPTADTTPEAPGTGDARSLAYTYRRWQTAEPSSTSVEYVINYDLVDDTYLGDIRPDDGSGGTIIGTDAVYRNSVGPDGVTERVPRSAASLDPAADFPMAKLVTVDDVVPPAAEPFLSPGEVSVGIGMTTYRHELDVPAWQRADPAGYRAWLEIWNDPGPASVGLVDLTGRQVSATRSDAGPLSDWVPSEITDFPDEPAGGQAAVLFTVDTNGQVLAASIIDRNAGFRSSYAFEGMFDDASWFDLGEHRWIDAP